MIQNWAKSGIHLLSDLYTEGRLNEDSIKNRLIRRAGSFFEMWQLKRAIPSTFHNINKNEGLVRGGKGYLLQMNFMIPNIGIKSLEELTSKDIYDIFNLSGAPTIPSQRYWSNKLSRDDIDWDTFFHVNINNKFMPRNVADFNFKCVHGLNRTGIKLKAMKLGVGTCSTCRIKDENLEHILYECNNSGFIWNVVENFLKNTFEDNSIILSKSEVLTGFWSDIISHKLLLINVIISITKFHIWKMRNKTRYDFELIRLDKSMRILKWSILNHITMLKKSNSLKVDLTNLLDVMESKLPTYFK